MTKDELLAKIEKGKYSDEQLLSWIKCLPSSLNVIKPNILKKGDVLFHKNLYHPIIILKVKKDSYICCMMTSKELSVTTPCNSRFFNESYISNVLLEVDKEYMNNCHYKGVYDNNKHLTEIHKQLLESFK
jgi:hypothetical protein